MIWLENATDHEMQAALARSYCYIQGSVAEGFGLPIIEAAHLGLPVIASDIPVFREIGGRQLTYFPVADGAALAAVIRRALEVRPEPAQVESLTWAQSATALLEALDVG